MTEKINPASNKVHQTSTGVFFFYKTIQKFMHERHKYRDFSIHTERC